MADGGEVQDRKRRQDMLKMFYGSEKAEANHKTSTDPYDINAASFQPDAYLSKMLKERSLTELMDKETEMVKHIKLLDSDMQTLVYENYNKFISATDTIRKMKTDFKKMEDEMDRLSSNVTAITEFSGRISGTLQNRRQEIQKLSGVHTLLKKLQFLFELPARLNKCIEMGAYSQAVSYYCKARTVLHQYQHVTSFQAIQSECNDIVKQLCATLRGQFQDKHSSAKQLTECVDLLLQLNEPAEELCDEFLSHARQKIDSDLHLLEEQISLHSQTAKTASSSSATNDESSLSLTPMDILEFVDCGCNGFLSNICLVIASYNDMFLNRQQDNEQLDAIAQKKLVQFIHELMERYFSLVRERVQPEKETGDNAILVRALDRFHRRLQAMNQLLPDTDFSRAGTDIVSQAARDRVGHYLHSLHQHFADCLTDIRQSLAAPKLTKQSSTTQLADLLQTLHNSLLDQIKVVLANLQAFLATDISFAQKPYFRGPFCTQDVREGLVVTFLRHIMQVCNELCETTGEKTSLPPALLLILSRLCGDLEKSTVIYLITLVEEQFSLAGQNETTTPTSAILEGLTDTAQRLLNHYVRVQGLIISQMLRKSVETRDWLNTIEPRNVRAVMKRVVEDISAIDAQVGELYEEGVRKERSSDSTHRSFTHHSQSRGGGARSNWSFTPRSVISKAGCARSNWSFTPSNVDNNLMSNIQKLFSEKIEIFSAVEASKVSVLTGIVKISLKTLLECIRVRTFGRYGLQQVQVDTHYLQMYLWRFVHDENLVHFLLDEIVGSTVHRCLDPVLMEPSVVELICERG